MEAGRVSPRCQSVAGAAGPDPCLRRARASGPIAASGPDGQTGPAACAGGRCDCDADGSDRCHRRPPRAVDKTAKSRADRRGWREAATLVHISPPATEEPVSQWRADRIPALSSPIWEPMESLKTDSQLFTGRRLRSLQTPTPKPVPASSPPASCPTFRNGVWWALLALAIVPSLWLARVLPVDRTGRFKPLVILARPSGLVSAWPSRPTQARTYLRGTYRWNNKTTRCVQPAADPGGGVRGHPASAATRATACSRRSRFARASALAQ